MFKQWKRAGGLLTAAAALALAMFLVLPLAATGGKPDKPPGKDKEPPPSPGTGQIAFSRGSWGDAELVVRNLDTGTETVLASSAANPDFRGFFRCTWSHTEDVQGRWIVFQAAVPAPSDPTRWTSELWAVRENGADLHSEVTNDDPNLPANSPALSRDDCWLAFVVYEGQVSYLYIQPFDLSTGKVSDTPTKLAVGTFYGIWQPTWSPYGSSIAFMGAETTYSDNDIFRADLQFDEFGEPSVEDLTITNLTDSPEVDDDWPDWSEATDVWPWGRIVFKSRRDRELASLLHVNPENPADVQIVLQGKRGKGPYPTSASWSPQATRIAFAGIYTINPDGTELVDLKISGGAPAWRP